MENGEWQFLRVLVVFKARYYFMLLQRPALCFGGVPPSFMLQDLPMRISSLGRLWNTLFKQGMCRSPLFLAFRLIINGLAFLIAIAVICTELERKIFCTYAYAWIKANEARGLIIDFSRGQSHFLGAL
jgi:hypothetical protein